MAEQDLDRNEAATPYKLQKAKEKGQVAKSNDVISTAVLAVAVVFAGWQGWSVVLSQFRLDLALLGQVGSAPTMALWPLLKSSLVLSLMSLLPFFACLMIAAVLANLMQIGFVFSFEPLKMDLQRINPVSGLKKVFSLRTVFDGLRAVVKLVLLLSVGYFVLKGLVPHFFGLASLSALGYMKLLIDDLSGLALKFVLLLGLIALVDLIYTRHEYAKKMRMSRKELTDENKHREGDPRVRARMRELRRELRKKTQSLRETQRADVLLTNPTHVAVALRYVHGEMVSPQLIAKGAGLIAAAMREIAARHSIPVVQSPALARKIFKEMDVKHHVPQHMFVEVARIIVWVFAMRDRQRPALKTGGR
ncbi:MAG: EscU/YscU/HrcU family type III secretion system export apparatus switch protein [Curvibacter sp.]|nr:EscU/YscU/HrcU family type III secretion system export apparatus switch protein [Curvibacter sp.]